MYSEDVANAVKSGKRFLVNPSIPDSQETTTEYGRAEIPISEAFGELDDRSNLSSTRNDLKRTLDKESPVERKRPRRSDSVYEVSYVDSTDSQAAKERTDIATIMEVENDPLQAHDNDVMKMFDITTLDQKIIKQCQAAFKNIKKEDTEKALQDSFDVFMNQVFHNSNYKSHDTHKKALRRYPGDSSAENTRRKPDLTVTDQRKPYMVFSRLVVELKLNACVGSNGYYEAFMQARAYAKDLFFTYGAVVPRKELWALITDGEEYYLFKFYVKEDQLRFVQYVVEICDVVTVLAAFARCYSFEPLEMEINLNIPGEISRCVNFNSIPNLHELRVIHRNDLSIVYFCYPYVVKMNGLPKAKEGLEIEEDVYKNLKACDSTLPILQPIGYYESKEKKCSALVFQDKGTVLQTVEGLHTVVRVLETMHNQLNLVHRDIRIPNLLRLEKRPDLSKGEGLSKDEKVYLIDFAFASKIGKPTPYKGSRETASEEVLKQIRDGAEYVTVRPQDDLISLVKVMILLYYNGNMFYEPIKEIVMGFKKAELAAKLLEKWENIKSSDAVESVFGLAWKAAEDGNYVKLTNEMIAIEQILLPKSK